MIFSTRPFGEAVMDDNTIPLSERAIFNKIVTRELFRQPCKCCGNPRRGIFSVRKDDEGTERIVLTCPVTNRGSWEGVLKHSINSMQFPPNPRLFARRYGSNVGEALKIFRRDGYAKHMSYMPLVDFENDVYGEVLRLNGEQLRKSQK